PRVPACRTHTLDHCRAPTVGHMNIHDDHVGSCPDDPFDRCIDRLGVADDREGPTEFAPDAGQEQPMIVDHEHADGRVAHVVDLGTFRRTSVPAPGVLVTTARPPTLSIRPSIESAMPRRSAPTEARSNPPP